MQHTFGAALLSVQSRCAPLTVDGDALGARELSRPDWRPGSVIYTGPDEPNLRVIRVLETDDERDDDPEWFQVLVVEEG